MLSKRLRDYIGIFGILAALIISAAIGYYTGNYEGASSVMDWQFSSREKQDVAPNWDDKRGGYIDGHREGFIVGIGDGFDEGVRRGELVGYEAGVSI